MTLINWEEKMGVGDDVIDLQHKRLLELINGLGHAMEEGQGASVMSHIIAELRYYALTHFHSEERYLQTLAHKEATAHKKAHEHFVAQINEFERSFLEDKLPPTVNMLFFMRDWLYSHIMVADKKYQFTGKLTM